MGDVTARIDAFCDAVPRQWAQVSDHGPLRLFTRATPGFPFYARPIPEAGPTTVADVDRVREIQRERGVPESFEWVFAEAPSMVGAVTASGLSVQVCPLLVLDGDPAVVPYPDGYAGRLIGPSDGDLTAAVHAQLIVASTVFGAPVPAAPSTEVLDTLRTDLSEGRVARLLVTGADGAVAAGSAQRSGDVVELVGIGTSATHRGMGLGAAVTAQLAWAARDAGADLVFLSAADDTATRVYERVGFVRIGDSGIAEG